jgi:beta-mannosidase
MTKLKRLALDQGWEFKQATGFHNSTASSFLPVAQFPTVAHIDLLHHNLIPDPYIDDNETKYLWVNDADWTYRTAQLPHVDLSAPHQRAVLVFEGLDTVVDVFLNGKRILTSKNMHLQHRVDVTEVVKNTEGKGLLELQFRNAPAFAREEMRRIGYTENRTDVKFGGAERLFLRKAQFYWVCGSAIPAMAMTWVEE